MNLLQSRRSRKILFPLLYFAEGAPIGFIWWALPTILRSSDAPIEKITTLVSFLVLPWALKFLWAPLVDVLRGPRLGFRGWILGSQVLMVLTLLPLLDDGVRGSFPLLAAILVVHAFAAATQDVAIDALVIQSTGEDERGSLNGWMQAGMLLGRSAFGGGALVLRGSLGDSGVVLLLIAAIAAGLLLAGLYREADSAPGGRRLGEFTATLRLALSTRSTWLALLFAAGAGAGFEAVGATAGPFLVDRGLSASEVGRFFALPSVACMLAGAVIGGALSDRLGRRRAVLAFHLLLTAAILMVAAAGATAAPLVAPLSFVYFTIGLFTASSYALFMDVTDPRLGSTQFSAFMGATNLCEAWAALAAGWLIVLSGYPFAFAILAGASMLALPALRGMRPSPVSTAR